METVGIRELKTHLSRHLKRVRPGAVAGHRTRPFHCDDQPRGGAGRRRLGSPARRGRARALEWRQAHRRQAAAQNHGQDGIVDRARGSPVTLYVDTSSLIKLYVTEAGSDVVRQLVGDASVVATSVVAYAETRAALARLRRERVLTASKLASAKSEFEEQWPTYLTLEATDSLCRAAGELAEKYRLRGFDSIHLASFAEVVRRAGTDGTRFSSFDDRLNQAARKLTRTFKRSASRGRQSRRLR